MKRLFFFLAGALVATPVVGYALWRRASRDVERSVVAGGVTGDEVFHAGQLTGVPAPVARFLRRTLPEGQRMIRTARLRQEGEFSINGTWRRLEATQVIAAMPPAFMWDATISAAPFMPVYVRDSYVGSHGSMRASVLAVYPIVSQSGTPELDAGALMRYLGEAVWAPTRLLPGRGLTWQALDDHSAIATLTDGPTSVSLQFRFDGPGDVVEIYAPDRFREVNGAYVPTPWRVRALGYDVRDGMRLMSSAVAEWVLPEGPFAYWRGRIADITYEY
jgi:hypothetical protein